MDWELELINSQTDEIDPTPIYTECYLEWRQKFWNNQGFISKENSSLIHKGRKP